MANSSDYALPFALLTVGGLLAYSGFKGKSITAVLGGDIGNALNPAGGSAPVDLSSAPADDPSFGGGDFGDGKQGGAADSAKGTPKNIIDTVVTPIAKQYGMTQGVDPGAIAAANAAHGPTVTGGRSDHQGPPEVAWADDMSNGTSPTPEMDRLAKHLAWMFGIPWSGSGAASATHNGYRYQLLYRTNIGGNHFNHVHLGIKKVG